MVFSSARLLLPLQSTPKDVIRGWFCFTSIALTLTEIRYEIKLAWTFRGGHAYVGLDLFRVSGGRALAVRQSPTLHRRMQN